MWLISQHYLLLNIKLYELIFCTCSIVFCSVLAYAWPVERKQERTKQAHVYCPAVQLLSNYVRKFACIPITMTSSDKLDADQFRVNYLVVVLVVAVTHLTAATNSYIHAGQ
jgi:hypothetical protein